MLDELQIVNSSLQDANAPDFSYEEILQKLTPAINHLLDKDLNALMNILYRIDVSEMKFKEVLANSNAEDVGQNVAKLILDRQIQKVKTRKKYS